MTGLNLKTAEQTRSHLVLVALRIEEPANAAEYVAAQIGIALRDLFFRPYTKKMSGLDLEEMDAAVVKRLPLRWECRALVETSLC